MTTELEPATAALLHEGVAGDLHDTSLLADARRRGDPAHLVDILTIRAVHHYSRAEFEACNELWPEAHELASRLDQPRPIAIRWHLANLRARATRNGGDLERAAELHREARAAADEADFVYGVRRSLLNLILVESERGLYGQTLQLLVEVKDTQALEPVEQGYATQHVGDLFLEMLEPDLALSQYQHALALLPHRFRRARLLTLLGIVIAHCELHDVESAARARDRMPGEAGDCYSQVDALLAVSDVAIAAASGHYVRATELGDLAIAGVVNLNTEPVAVRWMARIWAHALNQLDRHQDCLARFAAMVETSTPRPASDQHWAQRTVAEAVVSVRAVVGQLSADDRVCREVALAYEGIGAPAEAYRLLHEAALRRTRRQTTLPAAIELAEQFDRGLAMQRGSIELAEASVRIRRIGSEIEYITQTLLGDVRDQIDDLIDRFEDTDASSDLSVLTEPMSKLQETLSSLRDRERPLAHAGTVLAETLREHACRACDPSAAERAIHIERVPIEPQLHGARTDWIELPDWTEQIKAALDDHQSRTPLKVAIVLDEKSDRRVGVRLAVAAEPKLS